jgi:hypothetical protein
MRAAVLAACVVLLGLFVLRADHVARTTSQTFDEGAFYVSGISYWRTGDFRLNPDHPPVVKLLWAIPVALRKDVPFEPEPQAWEQADHWQVADGFLYDGPADHFGVVDHFVERHGQRAVVSLDDHGHAVADKNRVESRQIQKLGGGVIVGRNHAEPLLTFAA